MFEFHEKRRLQRFIYSRPFLVFMCLPVVFMGYAVWNAYRIEADQQLRQAKLVAELAGLQARADELEGNLEQLNDPRGVEAGLRQRYDVGRAGEEAIVFTEEDAPVTVEQTTPTAPTSFLERLFAIVF
jgi:cell division protein FtsB